MTGLAICWYVSVCCKLLIIVCWPSWVTKQSRKGNFYIIIIFFLDLLDILYDLLVKMFVKIIFLIFMCSSKSVVMHVA